MHKLKLKAVNSVILIKIASESKPHNDEELTRELLTTRREDDKAEVNDPKLNSALVKVNKKNLIQYVQGVIRVAASLIVNCYEANQTDWGSFQKDVDASPLESDSV